MDVIEIFHASVALITGLMVGSFLNVVIWRLPRGENLAKPRSACPGCGKLIVWYDNIPVLSWLALGAKCRGCKTPIAMRYPLVELLTGVLFLLAWQAHGAHLGTAITVALFLAALVAISFIDLDHRIIPDAISKPGIVLFVLAAPLSLLHATGELAWTRDWFPGAKPALNALVDAGLGAVLGAAVILLIRAIGTWILKKEAMGLGDVKLLAFIGAVVGPLLSLYGLVIGCFGGAIIGGILFLIGKHRPMPCAMDVQGLGAEGRDLRAHFTRTKVRDGDDADFEVQGAPEATVGTPVRVNLTLPATRILEDENAELALKGHIAAVEGSGDERQWLLKITEHTDLDAERVGMYARSYRYIPFGPFLALGGALCALYPQHVHWFMTEGYPAFARTLFGN